LKRCLFEFASEVNGGATPSHTLSELSLTATKIHHRTPASSWPAPMKAFR